MTAELSRTGRTARPPVLEGRRVSLRPVVPADYDFLFSLSTSPDISYRWRTRGHTPSPESFQSILWDGVLCQFIVERAGDAEPLGLISAYNADFRNQIVHLAVLVKDRPGGPLWSLDALVLFVNYLFMNWELRKIYAETTELSSWTFASGAGRYFQVEGTLREHEYYDGRYWDSYVIAIWRRDCDAMLKELLPVVLGTGR